MQIAHSFSVGGMIADGQSHRIIVRDVDLDSCADTFYYQAPDACSSTTATHGIQLAEHQVTVFPNPVQNQLNIRFNDRLTVQHISLYDLTGRKLISMDGTDEETVGFDMETFPSGVYTLRIETEEGNTMRKIVKQ